MAKMTDWNREREGWWMSGKWGWKKGEWRGNGMKRDGKIWGKWE